MLIDPAIPTIFLVRLRQGLVGESRRTVHVVPIDEAHVLTIGLIAHCGQVIQPGTAEQLSQLDGMPCEICFIAAAPSV